MRATVMVALFVLLTGGQAIGQESHGHGYPPGEFPWINDIHQDHGPGFCDNISSSGDAREIECWSYRVSEPGSRWTNCNTDGTFYDGSCVAQATVYCPGLNPGGNWGQGWIQFYAVCPNVPLPTKAGILGTENGKSKRGVECGGLACGCLVGAFGTPSTLWGSHSGIQNGGYVHCE
jgi:hypothetical protein